MCQERCAFPLCSINDFSGSGVPEDRWHPPSKQSQEFKTFSKVNLMQRNVFPVKLRWKLFVRAEALDTCCWCLIFLIDVFIWTHATFQTCLSRGYFIKCLGHSPGVEVIVLCLLNACLHKDHFSFSCRAVAPLRLSPRLWLCYKWTIKCSGHWNKRSMGDKQAERMSHHHAKATSKDFRAAP